MCHSSLTRPDADKEPHMPRYTRRTSRRFGSLVALAACAHLLPLTVGTGCGDSSGKGNQAGNTNNTGGAFYEPYQVLPAGALVAPRGWAVRRGIVHCHSPYSHDACDGDPRPDGERNEACFQDVRHGMCATRQDFVFLTDHASLFADFEYPEVLLYAPGDTLIERGGRPVANRVDCGDGHEVIVAAGTETGMMPIGLEGHVGDTPAERRVAYGTVDASAIAALKAAGALVFLHHTEEWAQSDVLTLPIDGIEIYNMHTNMMDNMAQVLELAIRLVTEPETMPTPELGLLGVFMEVEESLAHWSRASVIRRMPGVLATDAHQNVVSELMEDGDRLDSFRRGMRWFSNYVLVPDGPADDVVIKAAIGEGRLYGSFDYLGYPEGFDFHAMADGQTIEMGGETSDAAEVTLHVACPGVWNLNPGGPQPVVTCHLLRADGAGGWEEVDAAEGDLSFVADPGAYRAEVRMVPEHLRPWLGPSPDPFVVERVWIYANPIYVR